MEVSNSVSAIAGEYPHDWLVVVSGSVFSAVVAYNDSSAVPIFTTSSGSIPALDYLDGKFAFCTEGNGVNVLVGSQGIIDGPSFNSLPPSSGCTSISLIPNSGAEHNLWVATASDSNWADSQYDLGLSQRSVLISRLAETGTAITTYAIPAPLGQVQAMSFRGGQVYAAVRPNTETAPTLERNGVDSCQLPVYFNGTSEVLTFRLVNMEFYNAFSQLCPDGELPPSSVASSFPPY